MAETLMLTKVDGTVWAMLEKCGLGGYFDDNGDDADGNAWLPSQRITEIEADLMLALGYGRMVNAHWLDDEEIVTLFHLEPEYELAERDGDWAALIEAVENEVLYWAHYNAYGADDSLWVVVYK